MTRSAFEWMTTLQVYRAVSVWRSLGELALTLFAFVGAWAAIAISVKMGMIPLAALLLLPAAGLLVRIFIIQHDCGHGSFFRRKRTNDWVGRVLSVLTLIPYDYWRRSHATHHASSGNLAKRGIGDVKTLTVAEYDARDGIGRLLYRLYRHPLVLFGLAPAYLVLLKYRIPTDCLESAPGWLSTMGTNLAIVAVFCAIAWIVGPLTVISVHLPIVLTTAAIGVWLFFIQHQFDETHWSEQDDWNVHEAALHGSSHYALPGVLRWFTGNIGIHHVHHLSARIPFYRLPDVLRDFPELTEVGRVTLLQSLRLAPLALWDETEQRLVSFRQARRARRRVDRLVPAEAVL